MKISERFAEYGLTGAFFWVIQIVFVLLWFKGIPTLEWANWMSQASAIISPIPTALQASIGALLGTLGLIAIFFTGLLLDMFGSLFIIREMMVFKNYILKNKVWLNPVVEMHKNYIADDYHQLIWVLVAFLRLRSMREPAFPKGWRKLGPILRSPIASSKAMFRIFRFLGPYNRFQSFLFSFVLIYSGASKLDIFMEQVSLWRTSRAISTGMVALALECFIGAMVLYVKPLVLHQSPALYGQLLPIIIFMVMYFILLAASLTVTIRAYSRMCATLFSLAYVTYYKVSTRNE